MGSVGEAAPPEAITLIWVAPRRSWSRAALRTSSGPSQMMKPATSPPMPCSIVSWWGALQSPWPPVCERNAPLGRIRGPRSNPFATTCAHAGSSPPASRTVVKPWSSVSSMNAATRRAKAARGRVARPSASVAEKWTCASVRPGRRKRPVASITVTSRSDFRALAGARRAIRPSSTRTETPGRGSAPVPSMRVALWMRRVMRRLCGLSALRDPKCYARKLLGHLPELARNRLVAGGGAGTGGLWIAARLEEAAGADICTAGQRGIGRRVQDRQGPHLGALGKDAVADPHERAVRHGGGSREVRRRVTGVRRQAAYRRAGGAQPPVELEGEKQVRQLRLAVGAAGTAAAVAVLGPEGGGGGATS